MAWRNGSRRFGGLAKFAAGALLSVFALLLVTAPADAWGRHHHVHARHTPHAHVAHRVGRARVAVPSSPTFSAIVVDANSGRTLYSVAEDGLRHPASVTKVMTLYLLFEQLERHAMTLDTRIPVSEHAAAQEPSKLGVPAGGSIDVDDAIKAIVTRSANDIAVAVAEAIGGDETTFASMMTRKARVLGMANTVYRNASGLPNNEQLTTAHDLAVLGRSIQERFPEYFKYFSTHEFAYGSQTIGNHNHLLGRVQGVDGIKTGYTRASGFNLLTSVHRDGRSLVAVVMGGTSAPARDRIMENLIDDHIAQCSTVRTATMIAEAPGADIGAQPAAVAQVSARAPRPAPVAVKVPTVAAAARDNTPQIAEGDDDGEDRQTFQVAAVKPAAMVRAAAPAPQKPAAPKVALALLAPADRGWKKGPDAKGVVDPRPVAAFATRDQPSPTALGWVNGKDGAIKRTGKAPPETTIASRTDDDESDASPGGKGWIIQLGATDNVAKANALLAKARTHSRALLADAKPVTEKVRKGGDTLYRARFAGLEQGSAQSACRTLKRSGFECFAVRD